MAATTVTLQRPWPLLPPLEYWGVIHVVETGPAPWPLRKPRPGQTEWRKDWHAYYHIPLASGVSSDAQAAVDAYMRDHGRLPVVYYACRFETARDDATPLPVVLLLSR